MKVLVFDLGASSGKIYVASYKHNRIQLEEIHRFSNSGIRIGVGIYWDFPYIFSNLITGIRRAQARYPHQILSLGIDSFSNDFGLISSEGELLSCVRCYRDERTTRYRDELDTIMPPFIRHKLTGYQNSPSSTLMQLGAMQLAGQEDLLNLSHRLLHIPDLLTYFLTGSAASEYTLASVSQMYDYGTNDWNHKILDAYRIPPKLLAPIVSPGTHAGSLTPQIMDAWHLSPLKVVTVCGHDTASAYTAAPTKPNSAIISTGTWCLAGIETSVPIINKSTFQANISNEGGYPGPHHRLLKCVMGLWLLQEVRTNYASFGQKYSFAQLDEFARESDAFAYFIDPDDDLFFSQGNMIKRIQKACMKTYGSYPSTPGQITRCILESLAFKFRWTVDQLESIHGKPIHNIQITGGGCQDRLLSQFIANACNRDVHCGPVDATALGNALVQFISHGAILNIAQGRAVIRHSYEITTYLPKNPSVWEMEYRKFISLCLS